jgi:hypothetical protein
MRRVLKPLWILLALVFLIEAWLWDHLRPLVAAVVNIVAWDKLKTRLAALVEWLPTWAVLIVFVIPFLVLLPLKFLEVYLVVHRQWIAAVLVLVLAKLLGLGVTAFIFDVTKPKLLRMAWFRWLYELMLLWLEKAHALIDPIKARVRRWLFMFASGGGRRRSRPSRCAASGARRHRRRTALPPRAARHAGTSA